MKNVIIIKNKTIYYLNQSNNQYYELNKDIIIKKSKCCNACNNIYEKLRNHVIYFIKVNQIYLVQYMIINIYVTIVILLERKYKIILVKLIQYKLSIIRINYYI